MIVNNPVIGSNPINSTEDINIKMISLKLILNTLKLAFFILQTQTYFCEDLFILLSIYN